MGWDFFFFGEWVQRSMHAWFWGMGALDGGFLIETEHLRWGERGSGWSAQFLD